MQRFAYAVLGWSQAQFWGATVREFNLARQGYFDQRQLDRRDRAGWMSLLLSAQTGEQITAAQLLGEEATDVAGREAEAEKDLKKLMRRMKKAGLTGGKLREIAASAGVAMEGN